MAGDPLSADDRMGAVWCESHGRWECSKNSKRSKARCHGQAIKGLDACRNHCGESREVAKAKGQALMRAVSRSESSIVVSPQRALWDEVERSARIVAWWESELGELAEIVRDADGGQVVDARYRLYQQERAFLLRAADAAVGRGVEQQLVDIAREQGARLVATIEGVVRALGHDPADPDVRAAVRSQLVSA